MFKSNKSLLAIAVATLACLVPNTDAQNWQADISIVDSDQLPDPQFSASLDYYFRPLNHRTSAPWSELEFIDRISALSLKTEYSSQDFPLGFNLESSMLTRSYALGYTHRDANSPHVFSAALGHQRLKASSPFVRWQAGNPLPTTVYDEVRYATDVSKTYRYGVGYSYYLGETWTIGGSFSLDENSFSDTYTTTLSTNRLWDLGNQTWAGINLAVEYREQNFQFGSNDQFNFVIGGRYHFSEKTGIALRLELPEHDFYESADISVNHFLTNSLFINLGYKYTDFDFPSNYFGPSSDSTIQAKLGLRF